MAEYIKHPRTKMMLAKELIRLIDQYWARKITQKELHEAIYFYASSEGDKLFRSSEINATVRDRAGKMRLKVIEKMLEGYQTKL